MDKGSMNTWPKSCIKGSSQNTLKYSGDLFFIAHKGRDATVDICI